MNQQSLDKTTPTYVLDIMNLETCTTPLHFDESYKVNWYGLKECPLYIEVIKP